MNFQLFEGAQDDVTRLTAVCCMLLPHNPYSIKSKRVRTVLVSWEKDTVTRSVDIYIGVWEGFRRYRGYILALE